MGAVEEILKEELKRLKEAEKSYQKQVEKLPKGSLQYKKIKSRSYPYLAFRKGNKVVYQYVGALSKPELASLKVKIKQRHRFQQLLRQVRVNKLKVERMLYGKRRSV